MLDAYGSITYPEIGHGVFMGGTVSSGPLQPGTEPSPVASVSTVVAGGTTDSGAHWVMLVDGNGSGMEVEMGNSGFGWASASSSDGQTAQPDLDADVTTVASGSPPVVVGSVVATAAKVEVRPGGGAAIDVALLPAPASTGIDRSYFLTELPDLASDKGEVVALDADGAVMAHQDYDLSGTVIEPTPPLPCRSAGGGANVEPADCPPLPTVCPMIPAGGANNAAEDCINCPDTAMCAVPSCAPHAGKGDSHGDSGTIACVICHEVAKGSLPTGISGPSGTSSSGACSGIAEPATSDPGTGDTPPAAGCDPSPGDVDCSSSAVPTKSP
jgi:hypothetical protein